MLKSRRNEVSLDCNRAAQVASVVEDKRSIAAENAHTLASDPFGQSDKKDEVAQLAGADVTHT